MSPAEDNHNEDDQPDNGHADKTDDKPGVLEEDIPRSRGVRVSFTGRVFGGNERGLHAEATGRCHAPDASVCMADKGEELRGIAAHKLEIVTRDDRMRLRTDSFPVTSHCSHVEGVVGLWLQPFHSEGIRLWTSLQEREETGYFTGKDHAQISISPQRAVSATGSSSESPWASSDE